jgi:hypothetical protein
MSAGMAGRAVALVGAVCGLVAIWTDAVPSTKYWDDGTIGTAMLVLVGAAALVVVAALATGRRDLDFTAASIGAIGVGLLFFYPVILAFDEWNRMETGGFLGICSALLPLGALAAYLSTRPAANIGVERNAALGALLALAGVGLVVAGIWPDVDNTPGGASYWDLPGLGHSAGIFLIVAAVVTALLVVGAYLKMPVAADLAVVAAAGTLGFVAALPVGNAFDDFGSLRAGAWLAFAGGVVLFSGTVILRGAPLRIRRGMGAPVPAA